MYISIYIFMYMLVYTLLCIYLVFMGVLCYIVFKEKGIKEASKSTQKKQRISTTKQQTTSLKNQVLSLVKNNKYQCICNICYTNSIFLYYKISNHCYIFY